MTTQLVDADLKALEERVAQYFTDTGDVYTLAASAHYGVAVIDVTPEMRRTMKRLAFKRTYHGGPACQ